MKLPNKIILWAGVLVLVHIVAFVGLRALDAHRDLDNNPETRYPTHGQDSPEFVQLGHNLLTMHRFTLDGVVPETFRTPGYPFLIALSEGLGGSPAATIMFQILCSVGIFLLLYRIGRVLVGERLGLWGALVFVFLPSTIFHTLVLLSEIPFIFFFLLSLVLAFFTHHSYQKIFLAGISLGIAALIRPIALYLPIFYGPFLIYRYRHEGIKKVAILATLLVAGALLVVAPYYVRNFKETEVVGLSSVSTYNLARYNVRDFLNEEYGSTSEVSVAYNQAIDSVPTVKARTLDGVQAFTPLYKPILKAHFWSYIKFHLIGTLKFFFSSNLRYLGTQLEIPKLQHLLGLTSASPDLLHELRHGHIGTALMVLKSQLLITLDRLFIALIIFLAVVSICIKKDRFNKVLLLGLIAYFAILTGPVSIPRYRLPIEGLLIILALASIQALRKYRDASAWR